MSIVGKSVFAFIAGFFLVASACAQTPIATKGNAGAAIGIQSQTDDYPAGISVKRFGAVGDGVSDDTAALQKAFTSMADSGRCLYFPAGAYKITAELDWINQAKTLCLRGEHFSKSYIIYLGTSRVDAAIHAGEASPVRFTGVDISNLGIAANAYASYAFHGIRIQPGDIDNVAFMGGSVSSFQGDFWNGIHDLRNLTVFNSEFNPPGASPCVNGITFGAAPWLDGYAPSSQFTLTSPVAVGCTHIGLNLAQAELITVNNGQLSGNGQQLYQACSLHPGCNAIGNAFNDVLIEEGDIRSIPSEIHGEHNTFLNLASNSQVLKIYGWSNKFEQSVGIYAVQPRAIGNEFDNNYIDSSSTDAGTGTFGSGNYGNSGAPSPPPWNRAFAASNDATSQHGIQVKLPIWPLAANSCTVPVTTAMDGVTTATAFTETFAANPNAANGWGAHGGLSVTLWPTANAVNWSVCNQTAATITPGAMTLNVTAR